MIRAWHFTGDRLRDRSPIPPVGEWLEYKGEIVICESGLYASRDPFDAMRYAPGPILHLVECDWILEEQDDKLVCSRRRIIASKDATEGLRYFARMEALRVVHPRYAPDVVLDFLMAGDNALRAEAAEAAALAENRAAAAAKEAATWAAAAACALNSGSELRAFIRAAAKEAATWAAAAAAARVAVEKVAWEAAKEAATWAAAANRAEMEVVKSEQRQFFNLLVNEAFEEYL